MTQGELWQLVSLAAFVALLAASLWGMRRTRIRPAAFLLLLWSVNNLAYYIYVLYRDELGIPFDMDLIRSWGAIRNLQIVGMVIGALLIFEIRRWQNGD